MTPKPFRKNPVSVSYTGWKRYVYTCPQQHYLIMTGQRPKHRDQRSFFRGIVMHQVLEDWLNSDHPPSWIATAVRPTWERLLATHTVMWKDDADHLQMYLKAEDWGVKLAGLIEGLGLDRSLAEAEKQVERTVEIDGFTVRLNGKIDLLVPSASSGPIFFDLKASADKRMIDPWQTVFYSILMDPYVEQGSFAKHAGFILPAFDSIQPYEVTTEQRDWLWSSIVQMVRDILDDKFDPRPDDSKCFMCDVKHVCPVKGGMLPQGTGRQTI